MTTKIFVNGLRIRVLPLLSMAFPNMFALFALSGKVKSTLDAYVVKLRSGELDREVGLG